LGRAGMEIFLQKGLDSNSVICPSGTISTASFWPQPGLIDIHRFP
jgi:hypothetical protein